VRLDRCTLYNGGSTEKGGAILEMIGDTRTTDPSAENRITRLHITHSMLQANRPNTYLFRTGAWNGAVDARKDFAETAVLEDNVFFCADRPKEGLDLYKRGEVSFFSPALLTGNDGWRNGYPDLTLDEWRKLSSASGALRDQRSRWKESSVTVLDRLDPLKRKRQ
jgi:hypothetical protein